MLPTLKRRGACIQPISSNGTMPKSVAQDLRQSSKSTRTSGCCSVDEFRSWYIRFGIKKQFLIRCYLGVILKGGIYLTSL